MYMKEYQPKPATKKKVLKKPLAKDPDMVLPKPGKYAAPVPEMPIGMKDGKPALKRDFRYPSGVDEHRKLAAYLKVLYVNGKRITMRIKDMYVSLMNEVKDYCNVYDLLRYESSTKDTSIRKKLEYFMGDLRELGYLSPKNSEGTICFLKIPPPGFSVSAALTAKAKADKAAKLKGLAK